MNVLLRFLAASVVAALLCNMSSRAADTRLFELRSYYAEAGKLEDLHARFRNHTTKLFEKHGMENIGYWTPIENTESKLIYILAYRSKDARDASWKAFTADADWKQVVKESEANGKLVKK